MNARSRTPRRQQGMAVIMALLIVALAASASALVLWQQGLWWRQADNDRARAQLRLVADAGVGWAQAILRFDKNSSSVDHLAELWAQPLPQTDTQGVRVGGRMFDAQGRFNVNNLVKDGKLDPKQLELYQRLLTELKLPPQLASSLLAWWGLRDSKNDDGDAPALAHFPVERVEMLRWVEGYTPEVMARLAPQLTALPPTPPGSGARAINVNTATPALLRALIPGLGSGPLQVLLNQRSSNYFKDKGDFDNRLRTMGGLAAMSDVPYDVNSNYFLLESAAHDDRVRLTARALLEALPNNASRIVWREDGSLPIGDNDDNTP